uniref:Uncharacterized protein n=1 Tax=Amphimedon queenslandica TaxID=400682 RepID=A0A1X7SU77_AMPQE
MEGIMTKTGSVDLLSSLPMSPTQQREAWAFQKDTQDRFNSILTSLGKGIANSQAQRLNALGLSEEALLDLRCSSKYGLGFNDALLEKGIKSKALQGKIEKLIKSRP